MTVARLSYLGSAIAVVAAGLLVRSSALGLSPFAAKYAGSVLWGAMVFCLVGALVPGAGRLRIALSAAILAATVEFSQLLRVDWLDTFRATPLGALLLGRTFALADVAAYWAGIALACGLATVLARAADRGRA